MRLAVYVAVALTAHQHHYCQTLIRQAEIDSLTPYRHRFLMFRILSLSWLISLTAMRGHVALLVHLSQLSKSERCRF
jgi:hypothetical protein